MPAERLSMRKIRDVLRLRFGSRLSEREIGRSLLLSNGSVNSYLQRARLAGLDWPLPAGLDDGTFEGHEAFVAEAEDADETVLWLHFDGDVEQEVDVLAEVFGDAVDGPDTGDLVDVHGVRPRAAPWSEAVAASSRATTHRAGARDGRRCVRGRRRAMPADRRRSSCRSR